MNTPRRTLTAPALLATLAITTAHNSSAQTPGYEVLYSFQGGADGSNPNGVTLAKNGVLYGTTYFGGRNLCGNGYLCGTVYALTPPTGSGTWTKTVIHSFSGPDGALPSTQQGIGDAPGPSLVIGKDGTLYGITANGGSNDSAPLGFGGTVFELTPPATTGEVWTETVLYSFPNDDKEPHLPTGLLIVPSGAVYSTAWTSYFSTGVAIAGGAVIQLAPPATSGGSWTEDTLINFFPPDPMGQNPPAGVVYTGGAFYGTTEFDNSYSNGGCGSVYELSPPTAGSTVWTGTAIYDFDNGGGCNPDESLTVGPGGVLYGTTVGGAGDVFQLTPPATAGGTWTESVIYMFTGENGDGDLPSSSVVLGKNGVLYGATARGGGSTACTQLPGCGTVYQLTPPTMPGGAWTGTILHSFTGENGDGSYPGPLTLAPNGVLFGSTWAGGTAGHGTIFALKP